MRNVRKAIGLFCLSLSLTGGVTLLPSKAEPVALPLRQVSWESLSQENVNHLLGLDNSLGSTAASRTALLTAIDHSLAYLETPAAATAYQQYPVTAFSHDRVQRSLRRFRQLVLASRSPTALQAAVRQEFDFYQSVGSDGAGTVSFTGYFEPIYSASRVPTSEFQYPLYRLPPDFEQWTHPHPTRTELEGSDGLQGTLGRLRGLELVWLRDRLEAYLVQVQGSARLQLVDGGTLSVGFAGHTDYPYVSLGRQLVEAGKVPETGLTLPAVIHYLREHPEDLSLYIPRNNRFVFFKETTGTPATGSLGVPVTAERSIATDKSLMPPGALALIQTKLPYPTANGTLTSRVVERFVLDQDTGGAIRGAGRVDIFMGTGVAAGERAGLVNTPGQLYYLLLKN